MAVDDEYPIRNVLQKGVEHAGYACSTASIGEEALRILENKNVKVIITDISMPDMDGIELTRIIKEKYDSDVIVMTGFIENLSYDEVFKKGASDFTRKPVGIKELVARLEDYHRSKSSPKPTA